MTDVDVVHYGRVPDGGLWRVDLKNNIQLLVDTDSVGLESHPVDFVSPLRIGAYSFGEPFVWMDSSDVSDRGIGKQEGAISPLASYPREAYVATTTLPLWELTLPQGIIVHVKADAVVYSDDVVDFKLTLRDRKKTWMEALMRVDRVAVTRVALCLEHSAPYDLRPTGR